MRRRTSTRAIMARAPAPRPGRAGRSARRGRAGRSLRRARRGAGPRGRAGSSSGGDRGAPALEVLAVADRAVADERAPGSTRARGGAQTTGARRPARRPRRAARRGQSARPGTVGEGVERRDPGDGQLERQGESARGDEPHAETGIAAGAGTDAIPSRSAPSTPASRRSSSRSARSRLGSRGALRGLPRPDQAIVADVGGGVEGKGQHGSETCFSRAFLALSSLISLCSASRSRKRTAPGAPGGTSPALGPFDEDDRLVQVRLEVAPVLLSLELRSDTGRDGTRRGRPGSGGRSCTSGSYRLFHAERPGGAADEGGLPAPSSPATATRSPALRLAASPAATRSVSSGEDDSTATMAGA